MSMTVNTGWLTDNNGEKFAPKTLTSLVQTPGGVLLEDKVKNDIEQFLREKNLEQKINEKVSYAEAQVLTAAQQLQARRNIDAQKTDFIITATYGLEEIDKTYEEISAAYGAGANLILYHNSDKFSFVGVDDGFVFEKIDVKASTSQIVVERCSFNEAGATYEPEYKVIAPLNSNQGVENAGKLMYVGADGVLTTLTLGEGLQIVDGVLTVTGVVPEETEILFVDNGDGTVTISGVEFIDQGDGVVLMSGATFVDNGDSTVTIV